MAKREVPCSDCRNSYKHPGALFHFDCYNALFYCESLSLDFTEGTKQDSDKPRYDLIPPDALDEVAKVFAYGATKYTDRNWEKGLDHGRLFAAAQRHLWAYERRQDFDDESKMRHLSHAATCVLMLLASTMRSIGTDDRPINSIGEQK